MKKRTVTFLTGLQIEASLADNMIETGCVVFNLKVKKFQNEYMKLLNCPKYERNN